MAGLYDAARLARQCSPDTLVVPVEVAERVMAEALDEQRREAGLPPLPDIEECDEDHTTSP